MKLRTLKDMDTTEYPDIKYWVNVCFWSHKAKDSLVGPFKTEQAAFMRADRMEHEVPEILYAMVVSTPISKFLEKNAELSLI
jgi:hypothetical protein